MKMEKINGNLFSRIPATAIEKAGGYFFWIGFLAEILYLVPKRIGYDIPAETWWLRGIAFFWCLKIICTRYTKKEWGMILFLAATGFMGYYCSGMDIFFRAAMFVTASKNINRRTAIKALWFTLFVSCILFVTRGVMGIGGPIEITKDYGRGMVETRYCFGYSHPNGFHYSMFALVSLWILLYKEKMSWKHYGILLVANTVLSVLTRSRTGAIVFYFLLVGNLVFLLWEGLRESKWVYQLGYVALAGVILVSALPITVDLYASRLLMKLDSLLTHRLILAKEYLGQEPITLFAYQGADFSIVDMGLLSQLFRLGAVYSFFFLLAMAGLLYKSGKEKNDTEYIFVIAIIAYMAIEAIQTNSIYPTQTFIWVLLIDNWNRLFGKKEDTEEYFFPGFGVLYQRMKLC